MSSTAPRLARHITGAVAISYDDGRRWLVTYPSFDPNDEGIGRVVLDAAAMDVDDPGGEWCEAGMALPGPRYAPA